MALLPLPPLHFSADEVHELRALSDDLERETLRSYEEFIDHDRSRVDEKRWKQVRALEDLRVYRERNSYKDSNVRPGTARALQRNVYQHFEIGPQAAMAANSKMPIMMCVGTLPGLLDDVMYGGVMHDSVSIRTRAHYFNDPWDDNVMLASLESPTPEDPCNFLGISWFLRRFHLPMIVSDRDLMLLTAHRFGQLRNGERVAMTLYHSIDHRDMPPFKHRGILRMEMTLGLVFRQLPNQLVDVYMIGFIEPHGSTPEMFGIQDAAKTLLFATRFTDISFRKKLFWRMREKQKNIQRGRVVQPTDHGRCSLCAKNLESFFSSSGATCQICSSRVCSKCSIKRRIVIESTREETTIRAFDFCMRCTLETKNLAPMAVAREEVYERADMRKAVSSHSSSASSTRSS